MFRRPHRVTSPCHVAKTCRVRLAGAAKELDLFHLSTSQPNAVNTLLYNGRKLIRENRVLILKGNVMKELSFEEMENINGGGWVGDALRGIRDAVVAVAGWIFTWIADSV
ncbi:MAG: hypothetical protein NTY07_16945 [Bacteroidia bacterium]|nr:hypothetical protein [Bacteroidia bacterium]